MTNELFSIRENRTSGSWYFRGQSDASWSLTPTLHRQRSGTVRTPRSYEADSINHLECILRSKTETPERLLADPNYLLALGQHYGLPTRLLDFSYSPWVAAWFAASAFRLDPREDPPAEFAIFAVARILVQDSGDPKMNGIEIIDPPFGANDNLRAQAGVFISIPDDVVTKWDSDDEQHVDSAASSITTQIDSRRIKLIAPSAIATELVSELRTRYGVDASTLFPGNDGLVKLAKTLTYGR